MRLFDALIAPPYSSPRPRRSPALSLLSGWVLCCILASAGQPLSAQPPAQLTIKNVQLGHDGYFKVGEWTPIRVELAGTPGSRVRALVRAADPDGRPTELELPLVTLDASGEGMAQGQFRSGRIDAAVQILAREIHTTGATFRPVSLTLRMEPGRPRAVRQSAQFWMVIGEQPAFAMSPARWNAINPQSLFVFPRAADDLDWTDADDLDGLDVIALDARAVLSEAASRALDGWVRRGGRLVVAFGDTVSALQDSPLASWLPIRSTGESQVRTLGGLNDALPGSVTLRVLAGVSAADLNPRQGRVLASGLTGPLVMRAAWGVGQVTVIAVRLDQRPLLTWESGPELAAFLANVTPPWSTETTGRNPRAGDEFNPSGVNDLQTQLLQSVDSFPAIERPSHWVVMGWIALFALVVGPLDYVLVRLVLKRPSLTWLTLPIWIVLASSLALARAGRVNEQTPAPRQIDLVDVDLSGRRVRALTQASFYSLRDQRVKITGARAWRVETNNPLLDRGGWPGRPEESFRGMYRSGGLDETQAAYSVSEHAIEDFPTRIWSSYGYEYAWEVESSPESLGASALRDSGAGRLTGTFSHQLPGELADWFLAYDDFYFGPGEGEGTTLPPGETFDLRNASQSILRSKLINLRSSSTRQSPTKVEVRVEREQYDPTAQQADIIARMITFHRAAGGTAYTGLQNQTLARCDLSELLRLDRAVVFGRLKTPATTISLNTKQPAAETETFVRIILPVERALRDSNAPPPPDVLRPR